ncbi:MAG: alanine--tRNA ligase-related protein [Candidatus Gracilibacteria bacterium]
MTASELRKKYLDFFAKKHGHTTILGSSLIPENDPTVLFTTAGMHPLVPYLLGESHPEGKRLVDVQKCVRTDDIDEVGDGTHCTFFEMLGNWSLGDYFKAEAIQMWYELLTKELGIDPTRLHVTCFEGDENCPRDLEAAGEWEKYGFQVANEKNVGEKQLIFFYEKKKNWWGPAGQTGPCGPDTEIFFDMCPEAPSHEHKPGAGAEKINKYVLKDESLRCHPNCECGRYTEIGNNVFMQYNKTAEGTFEPLKQQNVDTGMGLERMTAILQGKPSHYETELFAPVMREIETMSSSYNLVSARIVADHIRSAVFILGDERGVTPSNGEQGYILRRLIRRAIRHAHKLGIKEGFCIKFAKKFIEIYGDFYKELVKNSEKILSELKKEEEQFQITLENGEAEIEKDILKVKESFEILESENKVHRLEMALNAITQIVQEPHMIPVLQQGLGSALRKLRNEFKADASNMILDDLVLEDVKKIAGALKDSFVLSGKRAFYYFESFGFPIEMTTEILQEKGVIVSAIEFDKAFKAHQEKSRAGSNQKFAGGLADHSDEVKKLHTATHLMLEALRRVLGKHVEQKGSNITGERLRFDFNNPDKLTPEQIQQVEDLVNEAIHADYKIHCEEMTVEDARKSNATGVFVDKYENELAGKVKVYFMGDYSKEICGGPHADHTGELGHFKILKEESSSAGIRRIKAVLEQED